MTLSSREGDGVDSGVAGDGGDDGTGTVSIV